MNKQLREKVQNKVIDIYNFGCLTKGNRMGDDDVNEIDKITDAILSAVDEALPKKTKLCEKCTLGEICYLEGRNDVISDIHQVLKGGKI
jgi:hypothetical protein